MRVVLDTNVFVSGIHWSGDSEKVLRAWFDNKFELVTSEEILEEFVETLSNFKKPMAREDLLHWLSLITGKGILVKPGVKLGVVRDDPDDDKFLEAALEGGADYIVSQDKHLLRIKEFRGVKIMEPKRFLKIL